MDGSGRDCDTNVRLYFHILTDIERLVDPDGQECVDVEATRVEAWQDARTVLANELLAGRAAPLGWRVQIADDDGSILDTISFAQLAFDATRPPNAQTTPSTRKLIQETRTIVATARRHHLDVLTSIAEAQSHLRTLAGLHAALLKKVN
jgi:hypothetical protein